MLVYISLGECPLQGTQIGLPMLLDQGSEEQFILLQEWIQDCDSNHAMCRSGNKELSRMPTRLVDVGHNLRLVDSVSIKPSKYVALSHCWGPLEQNQKFCTYKNTMGTLKQCIEFSELPPMFRDAITVTRGLGIEYIWIDSLCIIQDDENDWERESSKMEQVFSTAYCTLGASSATSSLQGFLVDRINRPCLQLQTKDGNRLYVCHTIDDFKRDVELGELNKRGWVLQERALSRRSIYYTSKQVYWECGNGVRCETLTYLINSKASFLGDANFPQFGVEYYRDGRQVLIQDLYERYSGLGFTKLTDRSVAILGLQERLCRAFKTRAAFGVFAAYFGRGILWRRQDERRMKCIAWPPGRHVPTWSWLSKAGAIKYMELKFEMIDWTKDFISPFNREGVLDKSQSSDLSTFRGYVRKLNISNLQMLVQIIFDLEQKFQVSDLRCVVIGKDKVDTNPENPKWHALVLSHNKYAHQKDVWERVGVASLRPDQVDNIGTWVDVV
ncbi:heterokaryon incompatibility protein-domain-containing protein [Camillea tinctor]|nr:heterokaryon incompatibility protein-domain-containing protein [Camillea tinctor]